MTTAYTPILKLALPVTGELNGTWGDVVNNNITSMVEQAVAGLATINTWTTASHTLTTADGTTSESRCAILECSGAPGAAATVICPALSKVYIIKNSVTGGYAVTLKTSAGTGISVPNGSTALLYCDGTNVVSGATYTATLSTTQVDILAQGDLRLQDTTGGEYVALQAPSTIASSYTLTLPVDDGTAGQALITDGSGVLSWSTAASGDVYGPASATDNAVARYDGTTGKIIQNSAVTIGDDGATVIAANSLDAALRITQIGAGAGSNALLVEDSANPDATPFVVSNNGRVFIGYTSSMGEGGLQLKDTTQAMYTYSADAFVNSYFNFYKSRSTTPGVFSVVQSGDELGSLYFRGDNGTAFNAGASITSSVDGTPGTNDMPGRLVFSTTADGASSPTERMRIDSAGRVGVGTTSLTGYRVRVGGVFETTGTTGLAIAAETTIPSNVTGNAYGFYSAINTAASAFTLGILHHYRATGQTPGAGSAITSQYGFHADSGLTGATNNYGFYSGIASGTGRWNFYAAGTADNYFAGNVGVGTTSPSSWSKLAVSDSNGTGFTGITSINANANVGTAGIQFASDTTYTKAAIGLLRQNANGNGSLVFYNDSNADAANWVAGDEKMRIASTGVISLGAAPGAESLRVTPVASAVNYLNVNGAITSGVPYLSAQGSDTNIPITFATKGTGYLNFQTGGGTQFFVAHTASAVNYLQVAGGPTVFGPEISAQGSATNLDMYFKTKGTGSYVFYTNSAVQQFAIAHTASAVNYLQVTGAATGNYPYFSSNGSDSNIAMGFVAKGTGFHSFQTGGGEQFLISNTASAVNRLQATGGATGNAVTFSAQGSDTNIDITLTPKGSGYVVVDAAYSPNLTLTDAATITWDTSTAGGQVATFTFVSSNRTMGAPTNLKNGGFYALAVIQNAGSNTLTWNAVFKWAGGVAPTLSTAAGAKDYFVFRSDGTSLFQQGISQAVA